MNKAKLAIGAMIAGVLLAPLGAYADGGFYIGASIGSAELSDDFDGLTIDSDATSYRILGGWRFNENFSVEAGYHDFGDFEQQIDINGAPASVSLSADGFTIGIAGALPVSDRFALQGRMGMFFWDGNAEINNVSEARPEDNNLYYGAGASYAVTDRFSVLADWSRYDLEETESDVLSVGFQFQFGA